MIPVMPVSYPLLHLTHLNDLNRNHGGQQYYFCHWSIVRDLLVGMF
jgi:hypothetical protein